MFSHDAPPARRDDRPTQRHSTIATSSNPSPHTVFAVAPPRRLARVATRSPGRRRSGVHVTPAFSAYATTPPARKPRERAVLGVSDRRQRPTLEPSTMTRFIRE